MELWRDRGKNYHVKNILFHNVHFTKNIDVFSEDIPQGSFGRCQTSHGDVSLVAWVGVSQECQ